MKGMKGTRWGNVGNVKGRKVWMKGQGEGVWGVWRARKVWMKKGCKGLSEWSVGNMKRKKGIDERDERDQARECGKCEE
jgi:hypothetical protein